MKDVAYFEKRLRDRLRELTERVEEVEEDLGQPADPDDEKRAAERESDEVLEGLGTAGLMEIRAIEAALERIAEGTYGKCTACGKRISEERLNAVPHAARCRRCA